VNNLLFVICFLVVHPTPSFRRAVTRLTTSVIQVGGYPSERLGRAGVFRAGGYNDKMKEVLIVGHCDLDHPQITSLIENNFSANVTRVKLLTKTETYLRKHNYDLAIINRIGAFDQESGIELIKEIKKDRGLKVPLMLVTNYKDQMDLAVKNGAVSGYGKDKLNDKETINLLGKYLS